MVVPVLGGAGDPPPLMQAVLRCGDLRYPKDVCPGEPEVELGEGPGQPVEAAEAQADLIEGLDLPGEVAQPRNRLAQRHTAGEARLKGVEVAVPLDLDPPARPA